MSPPLRFLPLALALVLTLLPSLAAAVEPQCEAIAAVRADTERRTAMAPLSGLAEDGASLLGVGVCAGRTAAATWEVTARQDMREGGEDRRALRVTRLSRRFHLDDAWSLTLGKEARGWDVGYAAQPLDVLGQAPLGGGLEDRLHEREASVLVALDGALGDSGFSLIVADDRRDPASAAQIIALAERQIGQAHVLALVQKPERQSPGAGAAVSTVVGAALELHASAFVRRGSDRPIHRALLDGRPAFFGPGATPVADWRRDDGTLFAQGVAGGQWTAESGLNVVAEWIHDGAKLSRSQWARLRALTRFHANGAALGVPPAGVTGNLRDDARMLSPGGAMRDYAFVRLSQPFDGWDGEVRALVNAADGSAALGLRVTVPLAGLGNGAARLWVDATTTAGRAGSEFGEVPAAQSLTVATSIPF